MGSLDIKSSQTSPLLESESTINEFSLHPREKDEPKDVNNEEPDEDNPFGSDKNLLSFTSCSSSISTPDSLEDPFQDSDNEQDKPSSNLNANGQLVTEHDEKANEESSDSEIPISSSTSMHNFVTPPIQVMEHPPTTKYRIPSSVFARKKSTAPVDWSMASNESLFSIQMGGMSFCNQDSMFWKSGELSLGLPGAEPFPQLFNLAPDNQISGFKSTNSGKNFELDETYKTITHKIPEVEETDTSDESDDEDKTHHSGKISNNRGSNRTEEHMNSVLRDDQGSQKSTAEERISHHSAESGGSTKSFAFPILSGETDKSHSARIGGSLKGIPEKSKSEAEPHADPQKKPDHEPQPQTSEPKTDPPNAAPVTFWIKWFPCFKCCTFCS